MQQVRGMGGRSLNFLPPVIRKSNFLELVHVNNGDKHILFHRKLGNPLIINASSKKLFDLLCKNQGVELKSVFGRNLTDKEKSFVQILLEKSIFIEYAQDEENRIESKIKEKVARRLRDAQRGLLIEDLQLVISNACNFACNYCYEIKGENKSSAIKASKFMDFEVAKKSIDVYLAHMKKNHSIDGVIKFFGGEPTLNWTVISDSLDYIEKVRGDDFSPIYVITTNGSLIDDQISKKLKKYNFSVQVSLDGLEKEHNIDRIYPNGGRTFSRVIDSLKCLKKYNNTIVISTLLSDKNIDNDDVEYIKFLKDFNITALDIGIDFYNYPFSNVDVDRYCKKIIDLRKIGLENDILVTGYWGIPYRCLMRGKETFCKAQGGFISVEPTGDIYPCKRSNLQIGNINSFDSTHNSEIYRALAVRTHGAISSCNGCIIECCCAGGCFAEVEGNIFDLKNKKNDEICSFYREITIRLLKTDFDKEKLDKLINKINRRVM